MPSTPTSGTTLDFEGCYRALTARDSRFDGQFYTAVRTTGIYCRPSCPAITPKRANVTFLPTAAAAQQAGYRACRRCLPDAAPGSPLWNIRSDLAARAMRLITDGAVERSGVPGLAASLGYSTRQLTRVLTVELGAGPLALSRAHRAHTARLLIQTSRMPMSEIAFAAGFSSIRQFNETVQEVFAVTPSTMRAEAHGRAPVNGDGTVTVRLPYREPMHRESIERMLATHAVAGLEEWADGTFVRTLRLPYRHATVRLSFAESARTPRIRAELALADIRDLGPAIARIRHLLDLDADPIAVDDGLATDPHLGPLVTAYPGIRLPGSVDGWELLARAILGQQVSPLAAATHTARLVAELGEPVAGSSRRLFPTAERVAGHGTTVLTGPRRRARTLVAAAAAVADGSLALHAGRTRADLRADLLARSGIGPWTADYVTMRLLGDPDILLDTDLVVRRSATALGLDLARASSWSPWRSYACMHLWHHARVTDDHRRKDHHARHP